MTLLEKINLEMKEALKSGDSKKLGVIRLLKSALTNAQINKGSELSEPEVIATLEKQAKQRRDSIEQYRTADRQDLIEQEQFELKVIEEYLPEKLSEAETIKIVEKAITETGANSIAQMGQVMKVVLAETGGSADASLVSKIVKEKLS